MLLAETGSSAGVFCLPTIIVCGKYAETRFECGCKYKITVLYQEKEMLKPDSSAGILNFGEKNNVLFFAETRFECGTVVSYKPI